MTSDTSVPIARVRDLPDLLGVIPHLLGFHPEESMVLVVQDEGQIELTARADLDDLRGAGHLELLIDRMLLRWPSGAIWLVAYTARERQGWRMLRRGRAHLGDALAGDPICVSGHRYRVGSAHGPIYRHDPGLLRPRPRRPCTACRRGPAARRSPSWCVPIRTTGGQPRMPGCGGWAVPSTSRGTTVPTN